MYYNSFGLSFRLVSLRVAIINVRVQHNGGFLPGIILLTQCCYHRGTNPFKCHEEVLFLQPTIPPKRFDIFSLTEGCSEGLDAFTFFFKDSARQVKTDYIRALSYMII